MQQDVTIGSITSRYLALFDPGSISAEFVAGKDPAAGEVEPPAKGALETLASERKAVILYVPKGDCEARVRVLVGEEVAGEMRSKAGKYVTTGALAVPSGTLVADGAEFIRPVGFEYAESNGTAIQVPPGLYQVELLTLVRWKSANYSREVDERASGAARFLGRLLAGYAIVAVALLWMSLFALPLAALIGWKISAFSGLAKGVLAVLAIDAALLGSFGLLEPMRESLPILSQVHDLAERFENQNPDVVVALVGSPESNARGAAVLTLRG
jgi:hypothetical protein